MGPLGDWRKCERTGREGGLHRMGNEGHMDVSGKHYVIWRYTYGQVGTEETSKHGNIGHRFIRGETLRFNKW